MTQETEILIIGAGAMGAYMAARFAAAGKQVNVFDAGPAWKTDDLVSSQIWARRLRWGGATVKPDGTHPFPFTFNAGWGYGGAALHHYGTWPRMHNNDFDMASRHGRGLDWPIAYEDLRPHYDNIQERAGLSGDAEREIWRPEGAPYPQPPLPTFEQGEMVKKGFDALGMNVAPTPAAILTRPVESREACIFDGWCDAGCPTGALYNPLILDIPEAQKAGAKFHSYKQARKLLTEGRTVVGAELISQNGDILEVRAKTVILAASVVHNPLLMLNSTSSNFPQGVGNANGLVGAYFMSHALAPVYGLFEEETSPYIGLSSSQLISHDNYGKDRGEGQPFGSYQWLVAPAMKPNDLLGVATARADLFGQDLHDFLKKAAHHIGNMVGFSEELPDVNNRISLTGHTVTGEPIPEISHSFSENSLALQAAMNEQGLEIMKAAGATNVWSAPLAQAHMMGGTIMGDDPASSVTDSFGRVHGAENLIITGSGLFPTGSAVNPTFTAYALAARACGEILG